MCAYIAAHVSQRKVESGDAEQPTMQVADKASELRTSVHRLLRGEKGDEEFAKMALENRTTTTEGRDRAWVNAQEKDQAVAKEPQLSGLARLTRTVLLVAEEKMNGLDILAYFPTKYYPLRLNGGPTLIYGVTVPEAKAMLVASPPACMLVLESLHFSGCLSRDASPETSNYTPEEATAAAANAIKSAQAVRVGRTTCHLFPSLMFFSPGNSTDVPSPLHS